MILSMKVVFIFLNLPFSPEEQKS